MNRERNQWGNTCMLVVFLFIFLRVFTYPSHVKKGQLSKSNGGADIASKLDALVFEVSGKDKAMSVSLAPDLQLNSSDSLLVTYGVQEQVLDRTCLLTAAEPSCSIRYPFSSVLFVRYNWTSGSNTSSVVVSSVAAIAMQSFITPIAAPVKWQTLQVTSNAVSFSFEAEDDYSGQLKELSRFRYFVVEIDCVSKCCCSKKAQWNVTAFKFQYSGLLANRNYTLRTWTVVSGSLYSGEIRTTYFTTPKQNNININNQDDDESSVCKPCASSYVSPIATQSNSTESFNSTTESKATHMGRNNVTDQPLDFPTKSWVLLVLIPALVPVLVLFLIFIPVLTLYLALKRRGRLAARQSRAGRRNLGFSSDLVGSNTNQSPMTSCNTSYSTLSTDVLETNDEETAAAIPSNGN